MATKKSLQIQAAFARGSRAGKLAYEQLRKNDKKKIESLEKQVNLLTGELDYTKSIVASSDNKMQYYRKLLRKKQAERNTASFLAKQYLAKLGAIRSILDIKILDCSLIPQALEVMNGDSDERSSAKHSGSPSSEA